MDWWDNREKELKRILNKLQDIQNGVKTPKPEAPVSLSMLTKRVVQNYGIARAGSRILGHLNTILRKMNLQTKTQEDLLWETANKLGCTRLGNNVFSSRALGIHYAQIQGGITTGTNSTFVLSNGGTACAEATLHGFEPPTTAVMLL